MSSHPYPWNIHRDYFFSSWKLFDCSTPTFNHWYGSSRYHKSQLQMKCIDIVSRRGLTNYLWDVLVAESLNLEHTKCSKILLSSISYMINDNEKWIIFKLLKINWIRFTFLPLFWFVTSRFSAFSLSDRRK